MKILITGGAGFIGSNLCRHFIEQNYEVLCLDNFLTGQRDNIKDLLEDSTFSLLNRSITDVKSSEYSELHGVIHLASPASPVDFDKYSYNILEVNSTGTRNALELARVNQCRFILASTSEVYGDPDMHPQTEDYNGNVNFTSIRGVYDESKRFAEALTMAYHRRDNVNVGIARIFNTYGPGMRADDDRVIPAFIRQALSNENITVNGHGIQTRSLTYIDDMVDGLWRLFKSDFNGPVNIGNTQELNVKTIAAMIRTLSGSESEITYRPLPPNDPRRRCPNITRAKEILGWQPKIKTTEGLNKTIDYFRKVLDEICS